MQKSHPIGRFAPSPTGPLHFGSLLAAVGSWLQARSRDGQWLLRIEDLDPPRVMVGADSAILRSLEAFGLYWDGAVVYQSARQEAYQAALEQLIDAGAAYGCLCTRKQIQARGRPGPAGVIYPGTCRAGLSPGKSARSWRVDSRGARIAFEDAIQGPQQADLEAEIGDFAIRRADGLFAYHLALVVDDAASGVTEVVRGQDLLACTPPQIHLQHLLGLPSPEYAHLPLAMNRHGTKLSKQTFAKALDDADPGPQLAQALGFLGHPPPAGLHGAPVAELLDWARNTWSLERIPRLAGMLSPTGE
ncbi:tRNA glutamyl-Q(34) synthetase GluQRS [Alkalilimnicola sp. S0819]|nr:tRNA glutamyl-Q(34) synthetase GluQRS [Alkalilimnicola sp. S0819]MPQ15358.1 tRNA glutamyl-Q(34) synthetase GluQRS [Alkalilimnicola sp. S0819]